MVTNDERREVAARLRACAYTEYVEIEEVAEAIGCENWARGDESGVWLRLADLIDPTCEAHRDQLFYPVTDLTPEHEETVFRCGACDEIVSYDEDYDPETDAPAYCEMCGSRITGIGEPWDE